MMEGRFQCERKYGFGFLKSKFSEKRWHYIEKEHPGRLRRPSC